MDAQTPAPVRTSAGIREAILVNRTKTQKCREKDDHFYRVDRRSADDYLRGIDGWSRKVYVRLQELRMQGIPAVYADICGRATGRAMGFDRSYTFALQPVSHLWGSGPEVTHVEGDIFSMRDFYSFIALIRARGDMLDFVTCEPLVGLQTYIPGELPQHQESKLHSAVTYHRLANNLERLLSVVRPGGYLFLDRPFQFGAYSGLEGFLSRLPQEQYKLAVWLRGFCKKHRCSMEIGGVLGARYLIRKWKTKRTSRSK